MDFIPKLLVFSLLLAFTLAEDTASATAADDDEVRDYLEEDEKESAFYPLIPQENLTDQLYLSDADSHRFQQGVQFYTFPNKNNPKRYSEIRFGDTNSLARSGLIRGQPVHIFAHGFGGRAPQRKHYSLINAYINGGSPNVIVVNYQSAHPGVGEIPVVMGVSWFAAQWRYAPSAGQRIADFIVFLINNRIISDSSQVHLLGHSLGGHVMGVAGNRLRTQYGMQVGRITGLDVAGPLYNDIPLHNKLDYSDAGFVDVIHTDIDAVGIANAIGHVDYYSNGGLGRNQNGCQFRSIVPMTSYIKTIICAHDERPIRIWGYGISNRVNLQACPCTSYGKRVKVKKVSAHLQGQGHSNFTEVEVPVTRNATGSEESDNQGEAELSELLRSGRGICDRPSRRNCIRFGEFTPPNLRGRYYLPISDNTFRQIMATSRRNEA